MTSRILPVGVGRCVSAPQTAWTRGESVRQPAIPGRDTLTLRFGEGGNEKKGILPEYIADTRVNAFFDKGATLKSLGSQSERIADKLRDNIQEAIDGFARQAREAKASGKPMAKIDGMTAEETANHSAIQDIPYMLDVVKPEIGLACLAGDRHAFYTRSNFLKHVKDVALSASEPGYNWFAFTPKGEKNPEGALILCVEDTSQTGGALKIARGSRQEQIIGNPLLTQPGPETLPKDSQIFARLQEIDHRFREPR